MNLPAGFKLGDLSYLAKDRHSELGYGPSLCDFGAVLMTTRTNDQSREAHNENVIGELSEFLLLRQNKYTPIIALCDSMRFGSELRQKLADRSGLRIKNLSADAGIKSFSEKLRRDAGQDFQTLIVWGFEVAGGEALLENLLGNIEALASELSLPVVFWVTSEIFENVSSMLDHATHPISIYNFKVPSHVLINNIHSASVQALSLFLGNDAMGWNQETAEYIPGTNQFSRIDLIMARKVLQQRGESLDTPLEAGLEYVIARETNFATPPCRIHFERSLALWRQTGRLGETAATLFYLGLGWMLHGMRTPPARERSYTEATRYFVECVTTFEKAHLPDLASRCNFFLCAALMRKGDWQGFEKALAPVMDYVEIAGDQAMKARMEGFRAELAIHKQEYDQAAGLAESALDKLDDLEEDPDSWLSSREHWSEDMVSYHRAWYLYSLAHAMNGKGNRNSYVELLMEAGRELSKGLDPDLYSRILGELQKGFFEMKLYGKSFHYYQEMRTLEQKVGCQAFMGPGRLESAQVVAGPNTTGLDLRLKDSIASEIRYSRMAALQELQRNIGTEKSALTMLHGPSGSGKSSLILAGLKPGLIGKTFAGRGVSFFYLDHYRNWEEDLAAGVLQKSGSRDDVLAKFDEITRNNGAVVLVFDQFEEHFFIHDSSCDDEVMSFICHCLELSYVSVVVAMRDAYLGKWQCCFDEGCLRSGARNIKLEAFTKEEALYLVGRLCKRSALEWEEGLSVCMIDDLAEPGNRIEPLELQIVGARMRAEEINRIAQYPGKRKLIQHWLMDTIRLCGPENGELVFALLSQLIEEETEISARDLENYVKQKFLPWNRDRRNTFEMVLGILENSGVLTVYPAFPTNRYRLAYEYLGDYIRNRHQEIKVSNLS